MALMVMGINYQTASVDLRSKLAFDRLGALQVAAKLVQAGVVREAVVVSTCNRTELYCEGENSEEPLQFLMDHAGVDGGSLKAYTYTYVALAAAMHLMRVATGLDSMVLGEAEILGQIKEAYASAFQAGTVGKHLGRLFQTSFAIAKEARASTGVGVNPVSVAYAAVKLSQHIFSDLSTTTVLLIGAGDLIRLTALHLKERGVKKITVANRSLANAEALALLFGGEGFGLDDIPALLPQADIVITGTASALPIVEKTMVLNALKLRKHQLMFMVDLSVPPNIESAVGELENIYLYGIDDLQTIVEENRNLRLHAAMDAENIIEEAAEQFMCWLQAQESFKILCGFRKKFKHMSHQLLQEGLRRLQLGEDPESVLKRLAYSLTNRFLHEPTKRLRLAGLDQEEALLTLTRDLFELNHETLYTK